VKPVRLGEIVELATFCGGTGSRWAERRTTLTTERGGCVEAASLWVFLDPASGRPARLPETFKQTWGDGAGREVSARLRNPSPPAGAPTRPWQFRSTDLDMLAHVNNAATWEAIEDELARLGVEPRRADLEHREAIEATDPIEVCSAEVEGGLGIWLVAEGVVRASALVSS
jgi:acyl-ACP thioesterase